VKRSRKDLNEVILRAEEGGYFDGLAQAFHDELLRRRANGISSLPGEASYASAHVAFAESVVERASGLFDEPRWMVKDAVWWILGSGGHLGGPVL
jgi:hypothetical protein